MHKREDVWPAGLMAALIALVAPEAMAAKMPSMSMCKGPVRINCVVDGDTFWLRGEKIRIEDIDTPEVSKAECPAELELAARATALLIDLLNSAEWTIQRAGVDRYGRTLATVTLNGRSVAEPLIEAGVAVRWGGRKASWC